MANGLAALGLLAFLLGCSGTFAEPQNLEPAAECSLRGTWKSDLNSIIEIKSVSKKGMFSGVYETAVSRSDKPIPPSPLRGFRYRKPILTFGFTVSWKVTESTTVFVGECLVDDNGKEYLKTIWLLREKSGSEAEDWKATRVGTDTFWRAK